MGEATTTVPPALAAAPPVQTSPAEPEAPPLNARLIGATFPPVKNLSQTQTVKDARESFKTALEDLIRTGESEFITFEPLFEFHHLGDSHKDDFEGDAVNGDTIYRIASTTKLLAVYTLLAKLGNTHLDDAITKHIPELNQSPPAGVATTNWDHITIRSLASMLSGISREYALDMSSVKDRDPGWPQLDPSSVVMNRTLFNLDNPDAKQLTVEESLTMIRKRHPMSSPFRAPFYSNTAFQLIAMAYERITGESIEEGFDRNIAKPLGLTRSSFTVPPDKKNAAVQEPCWSWDMAPYRSAGNAYSTTSDLAAIGRSILGSSILTSSQTNAWLKPVSHTGSRYCSAGMPWEILRVDLPLVGGEGPTRPVDIYTKQGALPPYCAILALSPDHGFGFVVLTRGPGLLPITELAVSTWVTAVEAAARADAKEKLAGTYQLREPAPVDADREAAASNDENKTYITLATKNDRTGLVINNLFVNGVDILNTVWNHTVPFQSVELWPTGDITEQGERIFQALEQYGMPQRSKTGMMMTLGNLENAAWVAVEDCSYGGYGLNEFVIKVDANGKGLSVRGPAWRTGEMTKVEGL